jgi:hypothetical protein
MSAIHHPAQKFTVAAVDAIKDADREPGIAEG